MKVIQIILLLVGLVVSNNIIASETSKHSSVQIDSSSVTGSNKTDILYKDGKEFLKNITVTTGSTLKTGYDIILKQQLVYAIQYLLIGLLCLFFIILSIIYYNRINNDKPNSIIPALFFIVLSIVTGSIFASNYNIVIQGLVNPDYAAIKDIIEMTKDVIKK